MRPRVASELLIDAVEVRAHGVGGEVKTDADLLVGQTERDEADDLLLSR
jgi:hypothetical protein